VNAERLVSESLDFHEFCRWAKDLSHPFDIGYAAGAEISRVHSKPSGRAGTSRQAARQQYLVGLQRLVGMMMNGRFTEGLDDDEFVLAVLPLVTKFLPLWTDDDFRLRSSQAEVDERLRRVARGHQVFEALLDARQAGRRAAAALLRELQEAQGPKSLYSYLGLTYLLLATRWNSPVARELRWVAQQYSMVCRVHRAAPGLLSLTIHGMVSTGDHNINAAADTAASQVLRDKCGVPAYVESHQD
jgi:hypothetical protein